jgi:hypothetical protein
VVIRKSVEADSSSRVQFLEASLPGYEFWSRGIELSRVFGIGSWRIMARKELGWERRLHASFELTDCYKSVARIRIVKTDNRSACVTVNCKMCKSAIAL